MPWASFLFPNSPHLSVHVGACVLPAENMKVQKIQKQTRDLESSCMSNVCKPTAVFLIAASGRTRVTSVR